MNGGASAGRYVILQTNLCSYMLTCTISNTVLHLVSACLVKEPLKKLVQATCKVLSSV